MSILALSSSVAAMLIIAFITAAPIPAQDVKATATITIQRPLPPGVVDYLKSAASDATGVVISGGIYKIPIGIAATYISGKAQSAFGGWLAHMQICLTFGKMWGKCSPNSTGIINVEIVVDQGPPEVRIIVPFFAKLDGFNNRGQPIGYVAPMNKDGNATMKYDVFGDGSLVLERMDCPKRQ